MNNLRKEKIASTVSMMVKNIFQKQNVKISLCWKNGYDINVNSVSDNLTEGNISLQVEVPTATPSSDEGPRMSKRKKKPPATKSEDFLW
jgi:hypothetical protein